MNQFERDARSTEILSRWLERSAEEQKTVQLWLDWVDELWPTLTDGDRLWIEGNLEAAEYPWPTVTV